MNHHLRFANGPSCTCLGVLLIGLLASCTRVTDPPAALSKRPATATADSNAVTLTTHFFTLPDGDLPKGTPGELMPIEVLTAEDGARLLRRLQRKRGAIPVDVPRVELKRKAGATKSVAVTRKHTFPTEYDPPVIGKIPEDRTGHFPVTPATPTTFETRDLGIKVTYGIHRIYGTTLDLDWQFRRTALVGDMNYGTPITTTAKNFFGRPVEVILTENKILVPVFATKANTTRITIQSGSYLLVRGRKQAQPTAKDASFIPPPAQPPASSNSDWTCLVHVSTGKSR